MQNKPCGRWKPTIDKLFFFFNLTALLYGFDAHTTRTWFCRVHVWSPCVLKGGVNSWLLLDFCPFRHFFLSPISTGWLRNVRIWILQVCECFALTLRLNIKKVRLWLNCCTQAWLSAAVWFVTSATRWQLAGTRKRPLTDLESVVLQGDFFLSLLRSVLIVNRLFDMEIKQRVTSTLPFTSSFLYRGELDNCAFVDKS